MGDRKRVLIIDDDEVIGEGLRDFLHLDGFEASYCSDAQSALMLSQATRFNIIITDFQMLGSDGLEVTRSIRVQCPESFIVGISSELREKDFFAAGANMFFKKPFSFHELVATIKKRTACNFA